MFCAMETLAERLKQARIAAGLTQTEVAARVGIAQPSYASLESGSSKGTRKVAELAHALGVSAYWLSTGRGPMQVPMGVLGEAIPVPGMVTESQHTYRLDAPDILQRLPIIGWDQVTRWLESPFQTEYSVPIWRRPGAPARRPYSDKAFALMVETDQMAPVLEQGSALLVDPQSTSGHKGWVLVELQPSSRPTIWQAIQTIEIGRPALKSVLSDQAPASLLPEGARVLGHIVDVI